MTCYGLCPNLWGSSPRLPFGNLTSLWKLWIKMLTLQTFSIIHLYDMGIHGPLSIDSTASCAFIPVGPWEITTFPRTQQSLPIFEPHARATQTSKMVPWRQSCRALMPGVATTNSVLRCAILYLCIYRYICIFTVIFNIKCILQFLKYIYIYNVLRNRQDDTHEPECPHVCYWHPCQNTFCAARVLVSM